MTTQAEAFQQVRSEVDRFADTVSALRKLYAEGKVPEQDREFVTSLLRAYDGRGVSIKQADWIRRLVERFTKPAVTPAAPVQLNGMGGVVELLNRAKANGLKFPKLWLRLPDGQDLRISVAGENAKAPGSLKLTNGERFGSPDNHYFGSISTTGELKVGRDGEPIRSSLVDLLTRLGQDPAKVAADFGHLTGHCCFCSLQLTDERSTAVGYGKRCAEKFGLPWGERHEANS